MEPGFDTAEVQDCNLIPFRTGFILSVCTQREAARKATAHPERRKLNWDQSWFCFKAKVQPSSPEA